jgi:molybdopterin/thiamine biosynthesis adenylyltransferase
MSNRYDRQERIQYRGGRWNQGKLQATRVLLVGAGNIGSSFAVAAAMAGFLHIDIVDHDQVSWPNLSRGVGAFRANDIGSPKAKVLAAHVCSINSEIKAQSFVCDIRYGFGDAAIASYDLVILATDDLASRRHVNRVVHALPGRVKAIINGGLSDLSFGVMTILPGQTPCYGCLRADGVDLDIKRSCSGLVIDNQEIESTATNGLDGMAVAALMAKEAAMIAAGLEPLYAGKELRVSPSGAMVNMLGWRAECTEHQALPTERLIALEFTRRTSLDSIRQQVANHLGMTVNDVLLGPQEPLIHSLRCGRCQHQTVRIQARSAALSPQCELCGNQELNEFVPEVLYDFNTFGGATSLAALNVPDAATLRAYVDETEYWIVPRV